MPLATCLFNPLDRHGLRPRDDGQYRLRFGTNGTAEKSNRCTSTDMRVVEIQVTRQL